MSATAYQRKRRELREQTSVSARLNEEGQFDPYAKADENYDQVGVKDQGERHQDGDPPPYSLTPHTPEQLHDPTATEDEGTLHQKDEGTLHQSGNPPDTSVTIRGGFYPGTEGDEREDQLQYARLDTREEPTADASLANVSLSEPSEADDLGERSRPELQRLAGERGVEGRSSMTKVQLLEALRGNDSEVEEGNGGEEER